MADLALLFATFAALTTICAKIGIQDVNSDFATFVRTLIILLIAGGMVLATDHWQDPTKIPARTWVSLILSDCTTGLSWLCYFRALQLGQASQVAPITGRLRRLGDDRWRRHPRAGGLIRMPGVQQGWHASSCAA